MAERRDQHPSRKGRSQEPLKPWRCRPTFGAVRALAFIRRCRTGFFTPSKARPSFWHSRPRFSARSKPRSRVSRAASRARSRSSMHLTIFIACGRVITVFCLKLKGPILSSGRFGTEKTHMNKPNLKTTPATRHHQRTTLAKVRIKPEDRDDYLAATEARARDTGVRIPMAVVHGRSPTARRTAHAHG